MKTLNFRTLYALAACILAVTSCREQETFESVVAEGDRPVASFTWSADFMTVSLTGTSQHAESSFWQFGDGATSVETSPVHTYAQAGHYTVSLKVNSSAGYSDTFTAGPVFVAGRVEARFATAPELGLSVFFDAGTSPNIASATWDFGDGATAEGLALSHTFPAGGNYTVKLKATGLLGDTDEHAAPVAVFRNMNLLKGSGMEAADAEHWTVLAEGMALKFGYADDAPLGGEGGCLRFAGVSENTNSLVCQGVPVEAGRRYRLSARIKAPAGAFNAYLQFYVAGSGSASGDFIESSGDPNTNHFLCLNSWNGWGNNTDGTPAFDGDLYEAVTLYGYYGLGAHTEAVYTATETATVYIGIKAFTQVSLGDVLVDSVLFELQE
jgi:chitodextrinase